MQISRLAFNCYTECRRRWLVESAASSSPRVLMASARSLLCDCGIAQSLHRIPTFGDRVSSLIDRAVQLLFRLDGRSGNNWKQFGTGAAPRGNFAAACHAGPAQCVCARRRARPASSRTDDAIAGRATGRLPTVAPEKRHAQRARNQFVW